MTQTKPKVKVKKKRKPYRKRIPITEELHILMQRYYIKRFKDILPRHWDYFLIFENVSLDFLWDYFNYLPKQFMLRKYGDDISDDMKRMIKNKELRDNINYVDRK